MTTAAAFDTAYEGHSHLHEYALAVHTPDDAAALVAGGCGCSGESQALDRAQAFLVAAGGPQNAKAWEGPLGFEGQSTGDGRLIEMNALAWEGFPLPLRYTPVDNGAHDGAVVVGGITSIERLKDGTIFGKGYVDLDAPYGQEAADQVARPNGGGVSMDLDSVSFEVRIAADMLDGPMPVFDDGEEPPTPDKDGRITVAQMDADDELMVTTSARVRAATLVSIPAFAGAIIAFTGADYLPGDAEEDDVPQEDDEPDVPAGAAAGQVVAMAARKTAGEGPALVAGAVPVSPPVAWFADPGLTEPTPLTVTEDGRVYGHIAVWGTCHTAYSGQCVEPPHSPSDYAYFRTGAVLTDDGTEVAVGHITLDTLHARPTLGAVETLAHYENTGRTVADVAAGEDAFGIWVAGGLRPGASEEKVRALRASPISGDWRRIGGHLELVAALAVNVPGFPVPRPKGLVASGVMTTLVASGMLAPRKVVAPGLPGAFSTDDLRYLHRLIAGARQQERMTVRSRADEIAASVRKARAAALARSVGVSV